MMTKHNPLSDPSNFGDVPQFSSVPLNDVRKEKHPAIPMREEIQDMLTDTNRCCLMRCIYENNTTAAFLGSVILGALAVGVLGSLMMTTDLIKIPNEKDPSMAIDDTSQDPSFQHTTRMKSDGMDIIQTVINERKKRNAAMVTEQEQIQRALIRCKKDKNTKNCVDILKSLSSQVRHLEDEIKLFSEFITEPKDNDHEECQAERGDKSCNKYHGTGEIIPAEIPVDLNSKTSRELNKAHTKEDQEFETSPLPVIKSEDKETSTLSFIDNMITTLENYVNPGVASVNSTSQDQNMPNEKETFPKDSHPSDDLIKNHKIIEDKFPDNINNNYNAIELDDFKPTKDSGKRVDKKLKGINVDEDINDKLNNAGDVKINEPEIEVAFPDTIRTSTGRPGYKEKNKEQGQVSKNKQHSSEVSKEHHSLSSESKENTDKSISGQDESAEKGKNTKKYNIKARSVEIFSSEDKGDIFKQVEEDKCKHADIENVSGPYGTRCRESAEAKSRDGHAQRIVNTNAEERIPGIAGESLKTSSQFTFTPGLSFMPHPVCFYGPPTPPSVFRQPTGGFGGYQLPQMSQFPFPYANYGHQMNNYQSGLTMQQQSFLNALMQTQKVAPSGTGYANQNHQQQPYFCTYMPGPTYQFPVMPGIAEMRTSPGTGPEADKTFSVNARDESQSKRYESERYDEASKLANTVYGHTNSTGQYPRTIDCPSGQRPCSSEQRCIPEEQWCDGNVQCLDGSDETACPCKSRVDTSRLCDGYFDCPLGEDEMGCFECAKFSFSCDVFGETKPSLKCFSLEQRCNGVMNCPNGRDEMDCSMLAISMERRSTFAISYTRGYLHRNYKGKWYPACRSSEEWAKESCISELGPISSPPLIEFRTNIRKFKGPFIESHNDGSIILTDECLGDKIVYVKCPHISCGTRVVPHSEKFLRNAFMDSEESNDDSISRFRRYLRTITQDLGDIIPVEVPQEFADKNKDLFRENPFINLPHPKKYKDKKIIENPEKIDMNDYQIFNAPDVDSSFIKDEFPTRFSLREMNDFPLNVPAQDYRSNGMNSLTRRVRNINDGEEMKVGDARVVGGTPSAPDAWPWVVALYRDGDFHCGGVLKNDMWIITAAHCVDKYLDHYYEVQVGLLRRLSFSPQEQTHQVSHVVVHRHYDRTDMKNDLALLRLVNPVRSNRWVRPVCLPNEDTAGSDWLWGPKAGTICNAVGWGAMIEHGSDPDHIREVEVPILPNCKHRQDEEGAEICAGFEEGGKDACQGDSGGPLLCRNPLNNKQWYIAGVVSHGDGCARPDEPGAYTRVSLFLDWIADKTKEDSLPDKQPRQVCPGYHCVWGASRCIPQRRRCDRVVDCLGGEDEVDCTWPSEQTSNLENVLGGIVGDAKDNITVADNGLNIQHTTQLPNITLINNKLNITESRINQTFLNSSSLANNSITDFIKMNDTAKNITSDILEFLTVLPEEKDGLDIIEPLIEANITTPKTPKHNEPDIFESSDKNPKTIDVFSGDLQPGKKEIPQNGDVFPTESPLIDHTESHNASGFPSEINTLEEKTLHNHKTATEGPVHNTTLRPKNKDYFFCKQIEESIQARRRCDRVLDCEDGTDEDDCSCRDYLEHLQPSSICDGHGDCADLTDEQNCITCRPDQFHCRVSKECIPQDLQCNQIYDCQYKEDEMDCFALTDGFSVHLDADSRPHLNPEGVVSISLQGSWSAVCEEDWGDTAAGTAGEICVYLGFGGYDTFEHIKISSTELSIKHIGKQLVGDTQSDDEVKKTILDKKCTGLHVKCQTHITTNITDHQLHTNNGDLPAHHSVPTTIQTSNENKHGINHLDNEPEHHAENTRVDLYSWPWHATIYVEGIYRCSGVLLDKYWIIVHQECLTNVRLHQDYVIAILGSKKTFLSLEGPHEQLRNIDHMAALGKSDGILLHMQNAAEFTRYVLPVYLTERADPISIQDICVATGKDALSLTQSVLLSPVLKQCNSQGHHCFERLNKNVKCQGKDIPWAGVIVCRGESGWYPSALYQQSRGQCGFKGVSAFDSVAHLKMDIINAIASPMTLLPPPPCSGLRCPLGRCLPVARLCDGLPDCRDGCDELPEICAQKKINCVNVGNFTSEHCECSVTEMRCKNGACVPKTAYCNGHNDCGDYSDEPEECNCVSYLKLAAPQRLCDGNRNCLDKSDENPMVCPCRFGAFKCGVSGLCVSKDFVCDGEEDCPNGEDEKLCYGLGGHPDNLAGYGEALKQSYGVWHTRCFDDSTPTQSELEQICKDAGFNTGRAAIGRASEPETKPTRAVLDAFTMVKLNPRSQVFVRGDRPLATLSNMDQKCHRLYLECT